MTMMMVVVVMNDDDANDDDVNVIIIISIIFVILLSVSSWLLSLSFLYNYINNVSYIILHGYVVAVFRSCFPR